MLKIIILDYSILGEHSRESALFSKKFCRQLTSLGHAGSPCFLSFCYLRCIVLTYIVSWEAYAWKLQLTCKTTLINPAVCLKTALTCKNTLTNAVVSWVMYTWNLRLTRKNALISAVVSWVVYTWNLQLTCKNALIIPVVSWVVYTWKLQLTCKDTLINAVVSRLMYT